MKQTLLISLLFGLSSCGVENGGDTDTLPYVQDSVSNYFDDDDPESLSDEGWSRGRLKSSRSFYGGALDQLDDKSTLLFYGSYSWNGTDLISHPVGIRFLENGTIDRTYDVYGSYKENFPSLDGDLRAAQTNPVTGETLLVLVDYDDSEERSDRRTYYIVKVTKDGSIDMSFGSSGTLQEETTELSPNVRWLGDDKFLVVFSGNLKGLYQSDGTKLDGSDTSPIFENRYSEADPFIVGDHIFFVDGKYDSELNEVESWEDAVQDTCGYGYKIVAVHPTTQDLILNYESSKSIDFCAMTSDGSASSSFPKVTNESENGWSAIFHMTENEIIVTSMDNSYKDEELSKAFITFFDLQGKIQGETVAISSDEYYSFESITPLANGNFLLRGVLKEEKDGFIDHVDRTGTKIPVD